MSAEIYNSNDPATGVNFKDATTGKRRWRTKEDQERVEYYKTLQNLYDGRHWTDDGGPFAHPYEIKAKEEEIKYQQVNLLAKSARTFADLISGEGITIDSDDLTAQELFLLLDFSLPLWQAILKTSIFGFVGLQPIKRNRVSCRKKRKLTDPLLFASGYYAWDVVDAEQLYIEFSPTRDEIDKIRKCVIFQDKDIGGLVRKKIDILYEETHYQDRVEYRLYEIDGEEIKQELDLSYYSVIDETIQLAEVWYHHLGDFAITILFNERIGNAIYSDYTPTAIKLQEGLNDRLTQINRILRIHSSPRLLAPMSTLKRDEETGQMYFPWETSEFLFYDDTKMGTSEAYKYLTWSGQLEYATADRDNKILSMLTEMDLSPQLLSYTHLVGGTSAETAEKLKRMLHSTIKRAERKRQFLDEALWALITNLLVLNSQLLQQKQLADADFSVTYPELIPRAREEIMAEVHERKQNGTITTKNALIELDNLSDDEAAARAVEIFNEAANSVQNPWRSEGTEFWPPTLGAID